MSPSPRRSKDDTDAFQVLMGISLIAIVLVQPILLWFSLSFRQLQYNYDLCPVLEAELPYH